MSSKIIFLCFFVQVLLSAICLGANTCEFADGFDLPVLNKDLEENLEWDVPFNKFGHYYSKMGGFHPGEDWNARGGGPNEDFGKPVRAIANGKVVKISNLNKLGYLIAISHMSGKGTSFLINEKECVEYNNYFSYPEEKVNNLYSVYVHVEPVPEIDEDRNNCVKKGQIIGHIINPGGGAHLHFEIRRPNVKNSNNWSMVGDESNWAKNSSNHPTGYYLDIQEMADDGLVDPSDFIKSNRKVKNKSNNTISLLKAGLYDKNEKPFKKTNFTRQHIARTGLSVGHYADGYYFINSKYKNITKNKNIIMYLVPNRGAYFVGADEMKGTALEVKRSYHLCRVDKNGHFLTVINGKKFGKEVNIKSKIINNFVIGGQYGFIKMRKQLIKLEIKLEKGVYVFYEAEGNVFDTQNYPKDKLGCFVIEVI